MRIRRRAAAWIAHLASVVVCLGGGAALTQLAVSNYCRARLQAAADQTALELARSLASRKKVSPVELAKVSGQIRFGQWDAARRQFHLRHTGVNAVDVIAEDSAPRTSGEWWRLPFTTERVAVTTHAVAAIEPRDIVLVVDLSAAMTVQTRAALDRVLSAGEEGLPLEEATQLRELYADLGFEPYPGVLEPFGAPWQAGNGREAYDALVSTGGPLSGLAADDRHRIRPGDPAELRRRKAYQAVIDRQITRIMPQARPEPGRAENFEYWAAYLDHVIASDEKQARIGYATYVRFMLHYGRNLLVGGQHAALSQYSDQCAWHRDRVGGVAYSFPPRTQPMHAVRRGLLAAVEEVAARNLALPPGLNRDRIAIVTFDSLSPRGAWIAQPLTSDYSAVTGKLSRLQAVGDRANLSTGPAGLLLAEELLRRAARAMPRGRQASPLVLFVTARADGGNLVDTQLAKMARLGQSVKTVPVGGSPPCGATSPAGAGLSSISSEGRCFCEACGFRDGRFAESFFTDAVATYSVALVE